MTGKERTLYDFENEAFLLDGANGVTREMEYGPAIDELVSVSGPALARGYAIRDAQGTVVSFQAEDGATQRARWDYTGYGEFRSRVGDQAYALFLYTGRHYDQERGDYYYRARIYNQALGRFLTRDPYDGSFHGRNPVSLNRYAYVLNNPTRWVDPTGKDATSDACPVKSPTCTPFVEDSRSRFVGMPYFEEVTRRHSYTLSSARMDSDFDFLRCTWQGYESNYDREIVIYRTTSSCKNSRGTFYRYGWASAIERLYPEKTRIHTVSNGIPMLFGKEGSERDCLNPAYNMVPQNS